MECGRYTSKLEALINLGGAVSKTREIFERNNIKSFKQKGIKQINF